MIVLVMIFLLALIMITYTEFQVLKKVLVEKLEDIKLESASRSVDYYAPTDDDYGL